MFFFFNDTATTEIYTLSLHDALPIFILALFTLSNSSDAFLLRRATEAGVSEAVIPLLWAALHVSKVASSILDRKSTRLNSSHANISYAVFCLKKKKKEHHILASHQ